jgi:catechol 2,3-dioxygenase
MSSASAREAESADGAGGIFAPRRLAHANLFVSKLDTSTPFYTETIGLQKVFDEAGISAVFLSNGNTHHDVALMEVSSKPRMGIGGHVQVSAERGSRPGLNHLGFEMESEALLVEAYRRALDAGVEIHRTTDHKISRSVYLFDPDGNYLEFYCDATKDWRSVYASFEGKLISEEWDPFAREPNAEPMYEEAAPIEPPTDTVFAPRRLARATVLANDLSVSLRFYVEVAGMAIVADHTELGYAILSGGTGGIDLALFQAGADDGPGLHHLSFELASLDDLQSGMARAAERVPDLDLRTFEFPAKRSVVLSDPDGIECELFVDIDPPAIAATDDGGRVSPFLS